MRITINFMKRGTGNLDAVVILAFLALIILISPQGRGSSTGSSVGRFFSPTLSSSGSGEISSETIGSAPSNFSSRGLSLSSGNASSVYQPYEEYIVLENNSDTAVNITGWQLKNGKDKRTYDRGGNLQRFSADIAFIPQATLSLSPTGGSVMQDVVLDKGERAVITTGSSGIQSPYRITSFKENMCTGYLERLDDYAFSPSLDTSCPRPSEEPGVASLDRACRDFIRSFPSCTTPEFDPREQSGDTCETCIDGQRLSSACAAFIKTHFSYHGCLAYHAGDPNFSSGDTWRIFLGRSWEMWAEDYESIELFDRSGNLVSSRSY